MSEVVTPGSAHLLESVHTTLAQYPAPNPTQGALRDDYVRHLEQYGVAGLFKDGPPQHITASCFVLNTQITHTLMTLHRKAGAWMQFGGHLEPGDATLQAAATREAREESGIASLELASAAPWGWLDRHDLFGKFTCAQHLDIAFVALIDGLVAPVISDESDDVAWWALDALPENVMPDVPGRLERIVAGLRRGETR